MMKCRSDNPADAKNTTARCVTCGGPVHPEARNCDDCCEAGAIKAAYNRRLDDYIRRGWLQPDIVGVTFNTSDKDAERANAAIWGYARNYTTSMLIGHKNFYIHGPAGVGKTHMARCMLMRAVECELTVMECNLYKLLTSAVDYKNTSKISDQAYQVHVLLLDDVDKAYPNRFTCAYLHSLIDRRCRTGRATIITSNYDSAAWAAQINRGADNPTMAAAILERLLPVCKWEMTGASLRRKGADNANKQT